MSKFKCILHPEQTEKIEKYLCLIDLRKTRQAGPVRYPPITQLENEED